MMQRIIYILHGVARITSRLFRGEDIRVVRYTVAQWDAQYAKGKWDYLLEQTANTPIVAWAALQCVQTEEEKKRGILDVGCGNGALTRLIAHEGKTCRYIGTDISSLALSHARTYAPEGTFYCTNMEHPNLSEKCVHVIVFNEVLYYGDAVQIVIAHRGMLADGGYVVISMYRTWRTALVWMRLRSQVRVLVRYRVCDTRRRVCWDVCVCVYREHEHI